MSVTISKFETVSKSETASDFEKVTGCIVLVLLLGLLTIFANHSFSQGRFIEGGFESFFAVLTLAAIINALALKKNHVDELANRIENERDRALYRRLYEAKEPRSVGGCWFLAVFLSPTISYLYQKNWSLAAISFITIQGLFLWWFWSIFSMPSEARRRNENLADQAYNELLLARAPITTERELAQV